MTSTVQVLKDSLTGCASGWGQVVTMLPFQNIKVKIISRPDEYKGYFHAFTKTISEEGFFSLWKGMLMPLMGVGLQVSFQFGIVETLKKFFKTKYGDKQGNLHWKYSFLCGALAGLPSAIIVTPLDHARFRVLMNKSNEGVGSIKMSIDIYKNHGLRKLYLGFNSTWLRQSALGVYFGTYDTLMSFARDKKYPQRISNLIAGGIAGVATWTAMYPVDYAKTRMQNDSLSTPQFKSALQYLIADVKAKGFTVMFTCFPLMIVRAFVVNAAGFLAFENAKQMLYQ